MRDEAAAANATTIAADFSDEDGPEMAKPARVGQARQRSWHGAARGGRGVALGALRRAARTACIGRGNAAPALFARRSTRQPRRRAQVRGSERLGRRRRPRRRSWRGTARAALSARRGSDRLHDRRPRLRLRSLHGVARGAALSARDSERLGSVEAAASAAPSERRGRSSARPVARLGLRRRRPRWQRS